MRTLQQDFLFIIAFLIGFLLFSLGETEWLRRRTKAGTHLLLFVTFTSNILSLIISFFLSYIIYLISVIAFGARETPALWALIFFGGILAVTATPLAVIKRLLLRLARIRALPSPWTYAVVTAIAFELSAMALFLLVALFV